MELSHENECKSEKVNIMNVEKVGNLANSRKFYSYANLLETLETRVTNQQNQNGKPVNLAGNNSKPYVLNNSIIQYYDVDEKPLSLKSQSSYYLSRFQDDEESSGDESSNEEAEEFVVEHQSLKSNFELNSNLVQNVSGNQFIDKTKLGSLADKSPVNKSNKTSNNSKDLSPELNENIKNLSQFLINTRSRSSSPRASFKTHKSFNQKHTNRIQQTSQNQKNQVEITSNTSTISSSNSVNGNQDDQFYLLTNQVLPNKVAEQYIKENYGLRSNTELKNEAAEEEPVFNAFDLKSLRYSFNKVLKRRGALWSQADGAANNGQLINGRPHGKLSINLGKLSFDNNNDLQIVNRQIAKKQNLNGDCSTSLMELVSDNQKVYWCEVPLVKESGILDKLDTKQRQLQEAHFELIASEASYLRSLNVMIKHFYMNTFFCDSNIIDSRKKEDLFSNIVDVVKVSSDLFNKLEQRWLESVYMQYCRFKKRQERTLKQLQDKPKFNGILRLLETNAKCQGLSLHSFLLLPIQRITRYPLLIQAILNRTDPQSETYQLTQDCLRICSEIVILCNAAAKQYEDYEELIPKLKFTNIKSLPTLCTPRWLINICETTKIKQEIQSTTLIGSFRTPNLSKSNVCIILLCDMIVIAKKKSDDMYIVIDFCNRVSIDIYDVRPRDDNRLNISAKWWENFKHLIKLVFLCNYANKKVEFYFNFCSENEKANWLTLALKDEKDKEKSKKNRSLIDTFNTLKLLEKQNTVSYCPGEINLIDSSDQQQHRTLEPFAQSNDQSNKEWSDEIECGNEIFI